MSTIHSILQYHITDIERKALYTCGFINGIGGAGKNIEFVLLSNIELLTGYNEEKSYKLMSDIKLIAEEHDIDFRLKLGFYWSNYKFARKLYRLLHWGGWKRIGVAIIAFILLNRHGKPYYNH